MCGKSYGLEEFFFSIWFETVLEKEDPNKDEKYTEEQSQ